MGTHLQSATAELCQVLFEEAAAGIFISDPQGRFLEVNWQGCDLLGYSREELVQLSWPEVLAVEELTSEPLSLDEGVNSKTGLRERQVRGKDGRLFTVEIRWQRLADGCLLAFVGDISKRKQAEEAMRSYELFADHSRDIILVVGRNDGRILEANATATKTYGYGREELLALSIHDLRSPETQGLTAAQMAEADTHGILFETVHQRQDGTTFPAEVSSQGASIGGRRILISVVRDISERKQTEEALRVSEEQYRLLFTEMLGGFALHEIITNEAGQPIDYRFITVNTAFEAMTGLQANDIVGKTVREVIPNIDPSWIERYGRVALTGSSIQFEDYVSDMKKYFEVRAYCPKHGQFAVIFLDITERKQAEAARQISEARLAGIIASAMDAIISVDEERRIVLFNTAAETMFGYAAAEMLGQPLDRLIPERFHEAHHEHMRAFERSRASAQAMGRSSDIVGRRANGEEFPLESSISQIEVAGVKFYTVIHRDVTQRKLAEETLREMADNMAAAQRIAHFGSWEVKLTPDLKIIDPNLWSDECYRIFGFEPGSVEATQELFRSCLHPDDREIGRQMIFKIIREGTEISYEYRLVWPDGTIRYIHDQAKVVLDEHTGQPVKVIGTVHDITERKQAEETQAKLEEQLRQAHKMESVGRLAGGIAHDFNNLLTVIRGYGDLIKAQLPDEDPLSKDLEQIRRATERAAALIRQLLAFSRKQMLAPTSLDLNELVTNLHKMLGRLIGEDINLMPVLQPGLWSVKADPGQIEQVIINLAVNARDAMPTGGLLTIETRNVHLDDSYLKTRPEAPTGSCVMLAVTDTGHGIDASSQTHVFEPFFTTKEVGQGTGLGLATVYGIIKQSGGDIMVYSEPGHGTTFKIYLPASETVPDVAVPPTLPGSHAGTETILLVEDEEEVRNLVGRTLQGAGYTVLDARHGAEALSLAGQYQAPIDLLLTDVIMPQMSGRELAEQLTALRPRMKVLFISGYTDDAVVRHGVLAAEVEYLSKPFSPSLLASKVRQVLDK